MKKLLIITLVVCLCAALIAGCSTKPDASVESEAAQETQAAEQAPAAEEPAAEEPAAEEPAAEEASTGGYRIGFSNASISNSWRVKMRDMLVAACEEKGVELIETDANDDSNTQISNIEMMLQQDLDALLVSPCIEDAVNPGIEMAYESGIPVIIFDRHCSTKDYTHFVGYSDKQNAVECANMMVEALTEKYGEPKGSLIALDSMAGSSTDNLNKEGWDEVLTQYPNIQIVARQYTDFEVSKGKSFMEDCLSKYGPGEIDGILSQDGGVLLGAVDAINEAGRGDEGILMVNADGINGVCRLIKDGKCLGLTQLPCAASVDALNMAIACIEGTDPEEQDVMMDTIVVTAENVDEYLIPDGDDYDWTF